ncbi:hypothetical protein CR513_58160, partial [Mucuna pruriens]
MSGIELNFLCHRLFIALGTRLVSQKKRKLGEENRRVAKGETKKLLAACFIREVQYPVWLASVVMVRKSSDKWRMCIDYMDLNKACSNDPYPLPNIDQLVDGATRYGLLSVIEAYSEYNQIQMHLEEEAKTTFITDSESATYQWLMDRIFKDHLGWELKVFVDDMVVKSIIDRQHCNTLAQVFTILKKEKLKLNTKKCSFGV